MDTEPTVVRVVLDTNAVVSALLFRGALSWLVGHRQSSACTPLVSRATAHELLRVLSYAKFGLSESQIEAFAALYLPFAERVQVDEHAWSLPRCRDPADHKFLAPAAAGGADVLVSGDSDLLAMQGQLRFAIETPAQYRARLT